MSAPKPEGKKGNRAPKLPAAVRAPMVATGGQAPPPAMGWAARLTAGASLLVAAVIVGQDWFRLGPYEPSGWQASDLLKAAFFLAVVVVVLVLSAQFGLLRGKLVWRVVRLLATLAFVVVVFRLIVPPDFGLGVTGVDVGTERLTSAWLGLGASMVAVVAAWKT